MLTWIENEIEENEYYSALLNIDDNKYRLRIYSNVEVEAVVLYRRALNE